jgi:PAS domain S-box-containing protein
MAEIDRNTKRRFSFANPRVWIWAMILFTILVSFFVTWIHYQQLDEMQDATRILDVLGTARVDLIKGYLHNALGNDSSSPYDSAQGYALLDQAVITFEEAIHELEADNPPDDPDTATRITLFREKVELFKTLLHEQVSPGINNQNQEIQLRVMLYELENQADLLDLALRRSLQSRTASWNHFFTLMLGIILLLLSGLCTAIISSMLQADRTSLTLKQAEEKYRLLADNVGDVIFTLRIPSYQITYITPSATGILGYSQSEMLDIPLDQIVAPGLLGAVQAGITERILKVMSGNASARIQTDNLNLIRKDGSHFSAEVVTTLMADNQGVLSGIVGVIRDVSERKKIETALRESEERHRRILDSMLEGFQIMSPDWRYLYLNDEAVRQSRFSREELMGSTFLERYPGVEQTQLFASLSRSMNERIPQVIENEFAYPDGEKAWFTLHIQPVSEGISILSTDTTEQKQNGFEFERKNQELAAAFEELASSEEELKRNYTDLFAKQEELAKNEEKFRTLADYTIDWEYWIDQDNEFVYITPSVEQISGYTPDEFYQKRIILARIIHPDDLQAFEEHIRDDNSDDGCESTFRIITRDQQVKWILHTCRPIFDKEGNNIGRRASNKDVTEKKRIEDELKQTYEELEDRVRDRTLELTRKNDELNRVQRILEENQVRLDAAQHIAHYGSWEIELETGTIHCSPEELRIFGYSPDLETVTLEHFMERVHADDREALIRVIRKITDERTSGSLIHRVVLPDGSIRIIHARMEVFLNSNGKSARIIGSSQDITELTRAEEERTRITNEIHDLYNNAPCGYHSLDAQGLFVRINDTELAWLGYSRDEIVNHMNIQDILTPESKETFRQNFPVFKETGSLRDLELNMVRKDGSSFPVKASASAIRDESGRYMMSRTILVDITEEKVYEQELSKSLHEKEILLKEIHHRVKNNMQVISSLLFMQARTLEDPQMIEVFNESQNRVRSLALIHEKLYQSENLDQIDYGEYLQRIIRHLFQSYKVSPEEITVRLDIHNIFLHIDKAVPCSLLVNEMISNSLKHAFPGGQKGEIYIGMYPDDDSIILNYSDNGIGLPENRTLDQSSSLGLQLIKGLASQLKGTIAINRERGTSYRLEFKR